MRRLILLCVCVLSVSVSAQSTRSTLETALAAAHAVPQAALSASDRTSLRNVITRLTTILSHQPVDPSPPPPPPPPPDPTGALFFSTWRELGCERSTAVLLDGGLWGDFGPSFPGTCRAVQVVEEDGVTAVRVTHPVGNQNGFDFRVSRSFPAQADVTATVRIKFAPNFRFATADHKMLLLVGPGEAPSVYANIRGDASDPTRGRIALHVIATDTVLSDRSVPVTVGAWHEIKVYARTGAAGAVRVKVDGQLLTLTSEAGRTANPESLSVGPLSGVKPDTTYNAGSSITEPMAVYYDWVAVSSGSAAF